jgi:hypothetical protein
MLAQPVQTSDRTKQQTENWKQRKKKENEKRRQIDVNGFSFSFRLSSLVKKRTNAKQEFV